MAEAKEVILAEKYDTEIDTLTCDPHRLQQMIWNLLTNAVKFTPPKGIVEIKLERADDFVKIAVTDTGQGIAPEFLPYVFDRFSQADSSSTRKHNGLGLGLAIVRHLAELHGGSIRADSDGKDKGASFILTLPSSTITKTPSEFFREDSNRAKPNEIANPELNGIRVLIVDDDIDTCDMLTYVLTHWGAETKSSASVAEALARVTEWLPNILLTDINMPGEDGYELINQLRALPPEKGANIPAIALTAMARPEDSEQVLSAGFHLHLAKPIDIEELLVAISQLTEKSARNSYDQLKR
jgi:CheY-like chemotaxis protein